MKINLTTTLKELAWGKVTTWIGKTIYGRKRFLPQVIEVTTPLLYEVGTEAKDTQETCLFCKVKALNLYVIR